MASRYLTKSRFLLAVECPTKLYFADRPTEYKNLKPEDSFLQMLADGGFQVGALAKLHYPDGIEITSKDHAAAEQETKELLKRENVTLFEAAIRHENLFVRIDILIKRQNTLDLIEVKSKSYDSTAPGIVGKRGEIMSEMRPYLLDVAFQTYVLRSVHPGAHIRSCLLMPDKSLRATVNGLNQLFKVQRQNGRARVQVDSCALHEGFGETVLRLVHVDQYIEKIMNDGVTYPGGQGALPNLATRWAQAYRNDEWITTMIGSHCANCEFRTEMDDGFKSGFKECWKRANNWADKDFDEGTVLDLWNFKRRDELIQKGVLKLNQVQRADLKITSSESGLSNSERQWMQVAGIPTEHDKGGFFLDRPLMRSAVTTWKYPYHFIDFETSSVALPFHKGLRPYEPIAFQFSHHIMESDGHVRHAGEFLLSEPGVFPNYEFARALQTALDRDEGTVFMWSHHENTILNSIAGQLENDEAPPADKPQLLTFLRSLIKEGARAMVDLRVLAQKAYFHPSTKGSNSIKRVLPAVLSHSGILKETYGMPSYGTSDGILSRNYRSHIWWNQHVDGSVKDPYALLKEQATNLLGEGAGDELTAEDVGIAKGGAAALAYARLQFEDLDDNGRRLIKDALLRYCELDSLAMVMILQAWKEIIES